MIDWLIVVFVTLVFVASLVVTCTGAVLYLLTLVRDRS